MARKGFFEGSRVAAAPPARTLPQCGACGLHHGCNTPKMAVSGAGGERVLFLATAPDEIDDEKGFHFNNKAGQYLRRVLSTLGFNLDEDGWKTNALICYPPNYRKPTTAEIEYCRPNLTRVIKKLKPTTIIPLGGPAVAAVLGPIWQDDIGPVSRWVGWRIPCRAYNAWVCPTWYPSNTLREEDPVLDRQFKNHLAAAVALPGPPWPKGVPEPADMVRRVADPAVATRWLNRCATAKDGAIAWDFETNMLKPDSEDARIVSCAVAWGRRGPERCIAFPWHGEAITAMSALLVSPIPKIASNLKFEDRWCRKAFGHRVRAWAWDTMLAAHVADNRPGITSVKFQAFVRFGVPVWNERVEPYLKTKGDEKMNAILREIDIMDLLLYNGLDALLEFRVACDQISELGYPWPW